MVKFTRLPTLLSLSVLAAIFLASSVESADDGTTQCKSSVKTTNYSTSSTKRYIVVLKTAEVGINAVKKHDVWLKNCWNIKTDSIDKYSTKSKAKDTVLKFSLDSVQGYSGNFAPEFVKKELSNRDDVETVEEDSVVTTSYVIPSNNLFKRTVVKTNLPNLDRIDQSKFPGDGSFTFPDTAGQGVNAFIVDTGIDIKHVEFEKRAKIGGKFCDGRGCDTDNDDNGHGSHVSGIVGGKTVGVARKVSLIAVKVLDADGSGSNTGVIAGLNFVLDQHKKNKNKNSVVNMSLGGGKSDALNKVVQSLVKAGIHVVVAAGNESQDACNTSPASTLEAVTVAALEDTQDKLTDFSNVGKCTDIIAPGRNIKSVGANTKNKFVVFSGTSQATPHVVGTVALIIAKDGNTTPAAMAKKLSDLSTKNVVDKATLRGTPNKVLKVPAA
nr:13991_t:CDS:1 [Entrophospora candida]CAG8464614.1 13089_t:CDS:1 [Entrophospora candida]